MEEITKKKKELKSLWKSLLSDKWNVWKPGCKTARCVVCIEVRFMDVTDSLLKTVWEKTSQLNKKIPTWTAEVNIRYFSQNVMFLLSCGSWQESAPAPCGFRAHRLPQDHDPPPSTDNTHRTFAATEDIASLLRFFLLDTAVPMLKWTRPRRENADHSTDWSAREPNERGKTHHAGNKKKHSYPTRGHYNYFIFIIMMYLD